MSSTLWMARRVLIAGDAREAAELRAWVAECPWREPPEIEVVGARDQAIRAAADRGCDLLLATMKADGPGGVALAKALRASGFDVPTVFVADDGCDAQAAVEAVRRGGDCLFRPLSIDRFRSAIQAAIERRRREAAQLPAHVEATSLLNIIEHNCDGILVVDAAGILRLANPAACGLLNRSAADLLGQPFGYPVSVDDRTEIDLVNNGTVRTVEMRVARIMWEGVPALLAAIRDVTARKRAEEAMLRFNAELERRVSERTTQLEAASRAKDQFLAALSHELRTPLTPVLLTVSAMEQDASLTASVRNDLQTIRHNIELEARLIDDLLDLSRIIRGKLQLNLRPTDPVTCLQRAIEICQGDANQKGVRLTTHHVASDARLLADPARLQQVFWNLLKNAIKFTPHGGEVIVRSAAAGDGPLKIEVRDNGIGIEPHLLSKIFDPFEQGDPAITRQFGGLGLGLAIAKAIVEVHRGRLSASSGGPGLGAAFLVELPVIREATSSRRAGNGVEPSATGSARAPTGHLLLIEDHAPTLKIMKRLLERMGHRVTAAETGAQAEALAEDGCFDLIVSDLGLPDCTGHELLQTLRGRGSRVKAIALSGYGREEDIDKSLSAGFTAHVTKPVDVAKLQAVIEDVLRAAHR